MFRLNGYVAPLYTCPMCQQSFTDFDGATSCVKNHVVPIAIESFNAIEDFGPETIVVNLSDGNKGVYVFSKIMGDGE